MTYKFFSTNKISKFIRLIFINMAFLALIAMWISFSNIIKPTQSILNAVLILRSITVK